MNETEAKTENLRAVLKFFATILESQHRRLDELSQSLYSLQSAVRGLDKTFDDVLKVKAAEIESAVENLAPLRDEQFSDLYETIAAAQIP